MNIPGFSNLLQAAGTRGTKFRRAYQANTDRIPTSPSAWLTKRATNAAVIFKVSIRHNFNTHIEHLVKPAKNVRLSEVEGS